MIAALFVQACGSYSNLPGVDAWDLARDARQYTGPWSVVAHPPCSRWCALAFVVQKRYGYRVGDDGGCFMAALDAVRTWGDVLEHPAYSYAWRAFGLPRPEAGRWVQREGAWVTQVAQRNYGHRARKLTWLYYVGPTPPPLDWSEPAPPAAQCGHCRNHGDSSLPRLRSIEASSTPAAFREVLIGLARAAAGAVPVGLVNSRITERYKL